MATSVNMRTTHCHVVVESDPHRNKVEPPFLIGYPSV